MSYNYGEHLEVILDKARNFEEIEKTIKDVKNQLKNIKYKDLEIKSDSYEFIKSILKVYRKYYKQKLLSIKVKDLQKAIKIQEKILSEIYEYMLKNKENLILRIKEWEALKKRVLEYEKSNWQAIKDLVEKLSNRYFEDGFKNKAIFIYWKEENYGEAAEQGFNYYFNSNQQDLHSIMIDGDVFTVTKSGSEIKLTSHLKVSHRSFNKDNYKHGKYRIWADENESFYFALNENPNFIPILNQLNSINPKHSDDAVKWAQVFQSVRTIRDDKDIEKIKNFTTSLKIHESSRNIVQEWESIQELEESIEESYEDLSADELKKKIDLRKNGEPKKITSKRTIYSRDPLIKMYAKKRAGGICECCGEKAPFKNKDGKLYLETHHVIPLSKGGKDLPENVAAVCPNCHSALHHSKNREKLKKRIKKSLEL
ncbi:MAG: hypothetical protein BAJALOKI3v1_1170004 [Promethearchaeota archaeon]|nr:MAG: hypothetical protein BAJALOKI3v1_1170004 [Candidatus Lokiarchaeota archaeon]